jgi:hypothetical protein
MKGGSSELHKPLTSTLYPWNALLPLRDDRTLGGED